jgi:hypothetical protein
MRLPRFRLRTLMIAVAFLALILTVIMQAILLRSGAAREQRLRAEVHTWEVQALIQKSLAEDARRRARALWGPMVDVSPPPSRGRRPPRPWGDLVGDPKEQNKPAPADRVMVPASITGTTQVGYSSDVPPPWPRGNCFTVSSMTAQEARKAQEQKEPGPASWKVANMRTENFEAIVRRLGLRTVEVQPLDGSSCLITDERIPREWLVDKPCRGCFRSPVGEGILRDHAKHFGPPADP